MLESALADIETHVHASGWDRPPALFALVRVDRFAADNPQTARDLGLGAHDPSALTPVEQQDLPPGPLDEMLAAIAWPDSVSGCAVTQEIVILPPEADTADSGTKQGSDESDIARAAGHPDRREARLVVGVLRDGSHAALLRLRGLGRDGEDAESADDLVTGEDLAPNLVAALLATFEPDAP